MYACSQSWYKFMPVYKTKGYTRVKVSVQVLCWKLIWTTAPGTTSFVPTIFSEKRQCDSEFLDWSLTACSHANPKQSTLTTTLPTPVWRRQGQGFSNPPWQVGTIVLYFPSLLMTWLEFSFLSSRTDTLYVQVKLVKDHMSKVLILKSVLRYAFDILIPIFGWGYGWHRGKAVQVWLGAFQICLPCCPPQGEQVTRQALKKPKKKFPHKQYTKKRNHQDWVLQLFQKYLTMCRKLAVLKKG